MIYYTKNWRLIVSPNYFRFLLVQHRGKGGRFTHVYFGTCTFTVIDLCFSCVPVNPDIQPLFTLNTSEPKGLLTSLPCSFLVASFTFAEIFHQNLVGEHTKRTGSCFLEMPLPPPNISTWAIRTRAGMLFIDFSLAPNTIIPQHLIRKINLLGLNTSVCSWILNFLTERPWGGVEGIASPAPPHCMCQHTERRCNGWQTGGRSTICV